MADAKETIINNVVMKMCLDKETSNKLKNILNIELYNYSVMETQETEVAIRDETFNEKILRLFIVAKTVQGCTSKTIGYYTSVIRGFADFVNKQYNEITANDVRFFLAVKKERIRTVMAT